VVLISDDMITPPEQPKYSTRHLVDQENNFKKIPGYKINIETQYLFYILIINLLKKKLQRQSYPQLP
jgi:hypothetical protein